MDIEVGHVPVAPSPPPRRRGVVVALVAAVGLVVIGLIVWFFVVPRTGDNAGSPGPRPVPDILAQPRWSDAIDVPGLLQVRGVVDPEAGDIAIVWGLSSEEPTSPDASGTYGFQAVNLATGAHLWSVVRDATVGDQAPQPVGSGGYLVIPVTNVVPGTQAWTTRFESIEARTGKSQGTVTLAEQEYLYVDAGMALTSGDAGTCARDLANPSACRWKTTGAVTGLIGLSPVFGGGRWVNTDAGVLDVRTGKPAGFGADGTYYDGPDPEHIVRVDRDARTVQPWDTTHDRPLNLAVHIGGVPPDGGGYIIDPAASRLVVPAADFGAAGSIVTSYDWGAGEQRWQTTVHSTSLTVGGVACAGTVLVRDGSTSSYVVAPTTALSASDGRPLWNDQVLLVGSGQRVVYLGGSGGSPVLDAYDAASADFAHLWSLDWPAALFNIVTAAGHVVAISMPPPMDSPAPGDTNHLWVLSGA